MIDDRWYGTCYDSSRNAAKFYDLTLLADGTVRAVYGRVGASSPAEVVYDGGRTTFARKVREKERKGYAPVEVLDGSTTTGTVLAEAAKAGLVDCDLSPVLASLVERIASVNRHRITGSTGGRVTFTAAGQATLPGGILVTSRQVAEAREVLTALTKGFEAQARKARLRLTETGRARVVEAWLAERLPLLERYLMLVPRPVGRRGWETRVLRDATEYGQERDLLDALDASVALAAGPTPTVDFRYRVREATKAEHVDVAAAYDRARLASHPVAALKVERVFVLTDTEAERVDAYAGTHGNVAWRWHGSQAHNVLSILRTGLQFQEGPQGGFDFHGALFGPGIYSSSMSTKAAGYGFGTWGGSRDDACFVLSAQVSRGYEYRVDTADRSDWRGSRKPGPARADGTAREYRSVEVYSAVNGARNPETIVWDTDAVRLRYLVQLGR